MGLDMYLTAKKYLSKYSDEADATRIKSITEMFGVEYSDDDNLRSISAREVSFEVAYWRKANAIHKWFVDNCQDGIDECQETWVDRARLQDLLDICKRVLENPSKAGELLPPQSGFFFGSTDIDDWYLQDVQFTADRLEKILTDPAFSKMDFYYQSSW